MKDGASGMPQPAEARRRMQSNPTRQTARNRSQGQALVPLAGQRLAPKPAGIENNDAPIERFERPMAQKDTYVLDIFY